MNHDLDATKFRRQRRPLVELVFLRLLMCPSWMGEIQGGVRCSEKSQGFLGQFVEDMQIHQRRDFRQPVLTNRFFFGSAPKGHHWCPQICDGPSKRCLRLPRCYSCQKIDLCVGSGGR
ncbi:expressed unknown protein [Seminavis robusta]|uniref:Uncharacterized protein n=1 Tax=Seminavis robusta TaxID=568900 RepID=A0A9N8F2R7_9STRA|nr:expressed unknown protein [Seminavis robusta]|eukprot:Sro2792_g337221.1  (118) ;mRNA; f:9667-10020